MASAVARHDVIDLLESMGRHQSSTPHATDGVACPGCGWRPTTRTGAPDAIRRVAMLGSRALGSTEQVARLRDEIHVTANRVARFDVEDKPILDPIRIAAPTASSATLAAAVLVSQLDLSATRLIGLVQACSDEDWDRAGQMGDTTVTIGDLVNAVLHRGVHDLVDVTRQDGHASQP